VAFDKLLLSLTGVSPLAPAGMRVAVSAAVAARVTEERALRADGARLHAKGPPVVSVCWLALVPSESAAACLQRRRVTHHGSLHARCWFRKELGCDRFSRRPRQSSNAFGTVPPVVSTPQLLQGAVPTSRALHARFNPNGPRMHLGCSRYMRRDPTRPNPDQPRSSTAFSPRNFQP
jgi:hypothetical protein